MVRRQELERMANEIHHLESLLDDAKNILAQYAHEGNAAINDEGELYVELSPNYARIALDMKPLNAANLKKKDHNK